MTKVGVAGTFNVLHRGHRTLLDKAFELGDEVVVGITSDALASRKHFHIPLERRMSTLKDYLRSKGKKWEIEVLQVPMGSAASDTGLDILVVSQGTTDTAKMINDVRTSKGLKAFIIVEIRHVLGEDCATITSTRVLEGEIDQEGMLLRPFHINVGSDNPMKIEAVRKVAATIYRDVEIRGVPVKASVGDQPWGDDIDRGAIERAKKAMGKGDYGVGIEAGIVEMSDGLYGIQSCAIADKEGVVTMGRSSSFRYPPGAEERIRAGIAVSKVFHELYGRKDTGREEGAIGFLSKGLLDRQRLSEQAVLAAMVPRIRPDIYFEV
jgi:inosine/xanthosine triphosphatase